MLRPKLGPAITWTTRELIVLAAAQRTHEVKVSWWEERMQSEVRARSCRESARSRRSERGLTRCAVDEDPLCPSFPTRGGELALDPLRPVLPSRRVVGPRGGLRDEICARLVRAGRADARTTLADP